jgi:hypothetical protein
MITKNKTNKKHKTVTDVLKYMYRIFISHVGFLFLCAVKYTIENKYEELLCFFTSTLHFDGQNVTLKTQNEIDK